MAEYDGLYVSHIRYKKTLMPAIEELVEIGKRAGVKVHISHMKGQHPGQAEEALEYIDKGCTVYTSPSPRDRNRARMPSTG